MKRPSIFAAAATMLLFVVPAAHAACTQAEATAKMQTILASAQYRELVSRTGEVQQPSTGRTALKSVLGRFGGAAGGVGADVMTAQDAAKGQQSAHDSASRTRALTSTVTDAGAALGRGDYETACLLYDKTIADLGIPSTK